MDQNDLDEAELKRLSDEASRIEVRLHQLIRERQRASVPELNRIDDDIEERLAEKREISARAADITLRWLHANAPVKDGPRFDLEKLASALIQELKWREDESAYFVHGERRRASLQLVAVWDDGRFVYFVVHVDAGRVEGLLGYRFEDDGTRWVTHNVEEYEARELSAHWFMGENLSLKIAGADGRRIAWQTPAAEDEVPRNIDDVRDADRYLATWVNSAYFSEYASG